MRGQEHDAGKRNTVSDSLTVEVGEAHHQICSWTVPGVAGRLLKLLGNKSMLEDTRQLNPYNLSELTPLRPLDYRDLLLCVDVACAAK